jgi:hypothetical protein
MLGRESTSLDAPLARYWGEIHLAALTLRLHVGGRVDAPVVEETAAPVVEEAPGAESAEALTPATAAPAVEETPAAEPVQEEAPARRRRRAPRD